MGKIMAAIHKLKRKLNDNKKKVEERERRKAEKIKPIKVPDRTRPVTKPSLLHPRAQVTARPGSGPIK